MDSIAKKRTAVKADTPNFQYNYGQANMSKNHIDTVSHGEMTKGQLHAYHNEEKLELLEKANAEYEAYFKEKTEEIENNTQLSQRKKNKALKKLNQTREDVRDAKMAEAHRQVDMQKFREGKRRSRGSMLLIHFQQESNTRVSQEADALVELSKEESTEIQQDADLLGVMHVPKSYGDTPDKQEKRMKDNRELLKGSKSADEGEGDAFADQLVTLVKELNPELPQDSIQGPIAIQRWKVADHAANLLDKRPEVRARLRQRDPDGLDRIYFMRTRYQMGIDYLDYKTSQASIQLSHELLDKKAKSGEFVSKRHQLLAKEKAFGFTLKSGTFEDYKKAKAEKLAEISQFNPEVSKIEHELNHGTKDHTVVATGRGTQDNFQQALKLVFGNQKLGEVTAKKAVNGAKVEMKAAVVQFNETYGEHKNPEEIAGEAYAISKEEWMYYKVQGGHYRVEGDPADVALGEPIFRAFSSFGGLPNMNDHDPEELAEMIRDLGAGYAEGEEKTEEKTAAFREQNVRGLTKFTSISDEHYARAKEKWMGCEHWPVEKMVANLDDFSRDVANVQVDGHVYEKLSQHLPDNESEAFEERRLLQDYFNAIGMGLSAIKEFATNPMLADQLPAFYAMAQERVMQFDTVKQMNERYGGGGAQ